MSFIENGNKQRAIEVLDKMDELISPVQFPMPFEFEHKLAKLYESAGSIERAKDFARLCIASCLELIDNSHLKPEYIHWEVSGRMYGPYRYASQMYELLEDTTGAKALLERLKSLIETMKSQMINQGFSEQEIGRINYNLADIQVGIDMIEINSLRKTNIIAAHNRAVEIRYEYINSSSPLLFESARIIERHIADMHQELGIVHQ